MIDIDIGTITKGRGIYIYSKKIIFFPTPPLRNHFFPRRAKRAGDFLRVLFGDYPSFSIIFPFYSIYFPSFSINFPSFFINFSFFFPGTIFFPTPPSHSILQNIYPWLKVNHFLQSYIDEQRSCPIPFYNCSTIILNQENLRLIIWTPFTNCRLLVHEINKNINVNLGGQRSKLLSIFITVYNWNGDGLEQMTQVYLIASRRPNLAYTELNPIKSTRI